MTFSIRSFVFVAAALLPLMGLADEIQKGHLLIVGGGLRPDNAAVFSRLIKYAGGKERARFGVFPTASLSPSDARQLKLVLGRLGVPNDQIQVIDITVFNAKEQVVNPKVVEQIRACTGLYFEGGDQTRITGALMNQDGSETPALSAIYEVWKKGGVIAGSSAGAAVQSEIMISASGIPDESLDEGMDALDFGLTTNYAHRGLLVTRGLAFFKAGIIDQHFTQYRGRLGRLSRVVAENQAPYGFGIDENTALDVSPDGAIEVVGEGTVTIVEGAKAKFEDGPLGCRISGVRLSCLEDGDRFDAKSGLATPREGKKPIVKGKEEYNGNFLIPDINGRGAALDAIISGLADNAARKQAGIALKHNQHYAHGYRFTFQKTDQTKCYDGYINGLYSNTVIGVTLDIAPVDGALRPPDKRWPRDLAPKVAAIFHRGILLADEDRSLRLGEKITRAELAGAIAQTIHLEPSKAGRPNISDVPDDAPFADEIALVVGNKLMELNNKGAFHAEQPVARSEAATILVRLAEAYRKEKLPPDPLKLDDLESLPEAGRAPIFAAVGFELLKLDKASFHATQAVTRQETAEAIYKIIGFPW